MLIVKEIIRNNYKYLASVSLGKRADYECIYKIKIKNTETGEEYISSIDKALNKNILGLYYDFIQDKIGICTVQEEGLFLMDYIDDCRLGQHKIPLSAIRVKANITPLNDLYVCGGYDNSYDVLFITDIVLSMFLALDDKDTLEKIDKQGKFYIYFQKTNKRYSDLSYLVKLNKGACARLTKFKMLYKDTRLAKLLKDYVTPLFINTEGLKKG
jgi:hypothetical protein